MKKTLLSFLICCLILISSFSVRAASPDKSLQKVTLSEVAHSIFYAPQYAAYELGFFEEEGIDLEIVTAFGADKVMAALLSNSADIGFMGSEATIYAFNEGASDYVINFAQLTQRAGNFLVARKPMNDFQWEDIKDAYVLGGRKGGMPEMVFEYILKSQNIDPLNDLIIDQNIDFGSTAAAFASGLGDYTIEFEPSATTLELEGSGYVVASLGVDSGYVPYTSYCAKNSYFQQHDDIIRHFTKALQKGMDYVNTHTPEEIASVISSQFPDSNPETIALIVQRYANQDTWKENLIFEKDSFDLLQDILESAGELSDRVPYEKLVTTDYTDKAS